MAYFTFGWCSLDRVVILMILAVMPTISSKSRFLEWASSNEIDDTTAEDMDVLIEEQLSKEQPPPKPDAQEPTEADNDTPEGDDTIAMAMALLVIENTHLREVIRNLRDTISGLTDHKLL